MPLPRVRLPRVRLVPGSLVPVTVAADDQDAASAGGYNPANYLLLALFGTAKGAPLGSPLAVDVGSLVVTDTENKFTIAGGQLVCSGGKASPATGDPGIWGGPITRAAGRTVLLSMTPASGIVTWGWDTNQSGTLIDACAINAGVLYSLTPFTALTTISYGTAYTFAIVLRATGAYFLVRGGAFAQWTLLGMSGTSPASNMYPALANNSAVITADVLRVPLDLWLPRPLCYDTFTRADGALGSSETTGPDSQACGALAWTGPQWAVSTNKAVGTPVTFGADVLTDGAMENWTSPTNLTNWTEETAGASTVNQETTVIHGGANAARFDVDGSNSSAGVYQVLTRGFYRTKAWLRSASGAPTAIVGNAGYPAHTLDTTYRQYVGTAFIHDGAAYVKRGSAAGLTIYADDATFEPLTLAELIATVNVGTKDVMIDVALTRGAGYQGGIVWRLDSQASPANCLLTFHDGNGLIVTAQLLAGVWSRLGQSAATYSAGAVLRVDTTQGRVYYNNAFVHAITPDASIVGTLHGVFSTNEGNSLDNVTIFATGANGEHAALGGF